ncbi:hypothetical protein ACIPRL_07800 [Streptomyces sp. NPDC090085]|uniref:hypothetical protein n=1 Tax=Streptomyces sp. NPDC090085 TaxID=3365943 RepID=UPI00382EE008
MVTVEVSVLLARAVEVAVDPGEITRALDAARRDSEGGPLVLAVDERLAAGFAEAVRSVWWESSAACGDGDEIAGAVAVCARQVLDALADQGVV